jgi:putative MATE family efflux protein
VTKVKADFTKGKILGKLVVFAIPMIIANLLQILFNAVDVAVVGQFAGAKGGDYQAAVGATGTFVHLLTNLFIGVSVGANVAMANAFGAKDEKRMDRVVHSSMLVSVVSGVLVMAIGLVCSRFVMQMLNTPSTIIDYSVTYLMIYFTSIPALMIYNFGASLFRAVGETKKPLLYLCVAGVLNLIINVVTVVFFGWNVVGVALGTVISQYVSAIWVVIDMIRGRRGIKFRIRAMKFHKKETITVLRIGFPMGISSSLFSVSNMLIVGTINSFGSLAMTGHTISNSLNGFIDAIVTSIERCAVTIVGQNIGAKKHNRVKRIVGACLFLELIVTLTYSLIINFFGRYLCMLYNTDPVIIEWTMKALYVTGGMYVFVVLMYGFSSGLKGMGYAIFPMISNIFFTCIFRVIYVLCIFSNFPSFMHTTTMIYVVYPTTWFLTGLVQMVFYFIIQRKELKKNTQVLELDIANKEKTAV